MYTQCPNCRTIFEVDEDALQASLGIVRCGNCGARFDALLTLSDAVPGGSDPVLPACDPERPAPSPTERVTPADRTDAAALPDADPARARDLSPTGAGGQGGALLAARSVSRARTLIADAAGVAQPLLDDPAWQVTELPIVTAIRLREPISPADLDDAGRTRTADAAPSDRPDAPDSNRPAAIPTAAFLQVEDVPSGSAPAGPATATPPAGGAASAGALDASPETAPRTRAPVNLPVPHAAAADDGDDAEATVSAETTAPDTPGPEALGASSVEEPIAGAIGEPAAAAAAADVAPAIPASARAAEPGVAIGGSDAALPIAAPLYVPPRTRRARPGDWLWAAGCVALALALAVQLGWAQRTELVSNPTTQPWALRVCARLACHLPPIHAPDHLVLASRDVRPDPTAAGALAITATIRNDAPFREAWPVIVLRMTDVDDRVVGMRRFRPADYQPDAARRSAGIPAGATVAIAFDVRDPGRRATGFRFDFE